MPSELTAGNLMGFFIDVYVEYLVRVIVRFFQRWNARSWRILTAEVTAASYRTGGIGCAVADVGYMYEIDDQVYTGINSAPFIFDSSARDYAKHYSPKSNLMIRVKPESPLCSVVQDNDQYPVEHGLRLQAK